MKNLLLFTLFIFLGCQKYEPNESRADKAQKMLDRRDYQKVIHYLAGRKLDSRESNLLLDAYIGASGFETLSFLEEIQGVLEVNVENIHPIQFLDDLLFPVRRLDSEQKKFVSQALFMINENGKMDNLKAGVLNLYSAVDILKHIGSNYRPKIVIDENNERVLLLKEEEKLELIHKLDQLVGALFRSYAHLRSSFSQISEYFDFMDESLENLLGVQIDRIPDFRRLNIEQAFKLFLENNPKVAKELAFWIAKECDSEQTLQILKNLRDQIKTDPKYSNFLTFLDILISEVEKVQSGMCNDIDIVAHL